MLKSNVGTYVKLELVEDTDEDLGVLYERTDEVYKHITADYFKTVAIRDNSGIGLHEVHGTVDRGLWLKIS